MFDLLEKNNLAFEDAIVLDKPDLQATSGRDSSAKLLRILEATIRNSQQFTDEQTIYLKKAIKQVTDRGLPKNTISLTLKALEALEDEISNPLRVINTLQNVIPERLLKDHYAESNVTSSGKSEVVLSMYLKDA